MSVTISLASVSIAAVSNLDNLAVGTALGIGKTRIGPSANLIIAAVTMAATAGAITSGRALSMLLAPSVAAALGAVIIIGIGALTVLASLSTVRTPLPLRVRVQLNVVAEDAISYRKAFALGIALSLNNVGTGVGAGVAGIPVMATTVLAGLFSLLAIGAGSRAGRLITTSLAGRSARLIAGTALLAVGAAMLVGGR
ncbi:MAG: hypothetical protein ACTHQQ_20250 [Solirubrobacteraceae bacterium]